MSYVLRADQTSFKHRCREELRRVRAVLGVAPCGFGKGVVMQDMVHGAVAKGRHVMILVHGRDRVHDAVKRATDLGIPHGVLMGNMKRERWHQAQIASSDTVYRMKHRPKCDFIIIDECDTALSPSFRAVLDFYPQAKLLGFTATPVLGNNKPLGVKSGGIFEAMVLGPSVKQQIKDGYLVGSHVFRPPPPEKLNELKKKRTGEFDENQGAAVCDNAQIMGDIVEHWKRYSPDRKAIAFGFHQAHAYHIAEKFREAGVNFAYVDASTPDGDIHTPGTRKFIWHQYDHGDLVGVSSCRITERGWDHSVCKAILLCSKVGSFPTYHQRLGRGSRLHPGFNNFYVYDFCGNVYEHAELGPFFESDIEWHLDEEEQSVGGEEDPTKRVRRCKTPVLIPDDGVTPGFKGPVESGYMLPCLQSFSPGPKRCPLCGIPLPVDTAEIKVAPGELEPVTVEEREAAEARIRKESKRKAEYLDLVLTARKNNYKTGYSAIVFRSKYGYFPPKGWKEEIELALGPHVSAHTQEPLYQ